MWLRVFMLLVALLLLVGVLDGPRPGLIIVAALLVLMSVGQVVMSRIWVRIDADGVHFPLRRVAWGDVTAVRRSRADDCVVLQIQGGRERKLGLAASESERVAALGGKKLLP
ncbi:MAG: hypothetical protein ABI083_15825 [Lapillicoccus sp.]